MTSKLSAFVLAVAACGVLAAEEPAVQLCEPWHAEYAGEDATAEHVVALWQFNSDAKSKETSDASGHGHDFTLDGAKINPEGRFGSCLESFPGWPDDNVPHQAVVKHHGELNLKGAFTIEMWIKPKPELNGDNHGVFLLDKKYASHCDYQLTIGRPSGAAVRTLQANLGFGTDSTCYYSKPAKFEPGVWYHVAFTYDGKGTGSFFLGGVPWGSEWVDGRGSLGPGRHQLCIGDRIGSYYNGFPGYIDQVRISRGIREFRPAKFERISDRDCFIRMEPDASLRFKVTNLQDKPLVKGKVTISLQRLAEKEIPLADLEPGKSCVVDFPLDTNLRPDPYHLVARLIVPEPEPYQTEQTFTIRIVPRRPPNRYPVLMWGVTGGVLNEMQRLKHMGFTHVLGLGASNGKIWEAGQPAEPGTPESVAATKRLLDEALANDMTIVASLSPGYFLRKMEQFRRVDRQGQPAKSEDVCGLFPKLQQFSNNIGASVAKTYGYHPAFQAALLNTEVRDAAVPCFHEHDRQAFRKHAGFDIPPEVNRPSGVRYADLPGFPANRVIGDDHPIYVYYRWYWKTGDGWNIMNTALHRGLKTMGRDDFWTFHDPAVRVASVYGSGGEVDVLSQWTYTYPDPIRIATATDEMLAMAAGAPGKQQVMKMTQIIWKRPDIAPLPTKPADGPSYKAQWEYDHADAPEIRITIAPMHLREAFWTKIARPIRGIMYFGWNALVDCQPQTGYRYTHPQSHHELARLVREVIEPLGPTLLQVPGVKPDVAYLESFASQMFAGRGTYGWGHRWSGDGYLVMLYAHLQPQIVYDETILQRGLDGFRVLVMTDCDVITRGMAERIKAFQDGGGLIVGDDRLAPAIEPDIRLKAYDRTGKADDDKAALLAIAAELREKLDGHYARYVDSSNPEIVPYRRCYKDTDYVFVVNDRREYGRYVGHYGRVMENGLPSSGVLSINRPDGVVYDLVDGREVPTRRENGKLAVDVDLGPCDGRVYMVSSRAVDRVRIQAPDTVRRGQRVSCVIEVTDADGRPLDAVVPLEVTIEDPGCRRCEFSGHYGAVAGRVEINLDVAPNDPLGVWQIEARELASRRRAVHHLRIQGPND